MLPNIGLRSSMAAPTRSAPPWRACAREGAESISPGAPKRPSTTLRGASTATGEGARRPARRSRPVRGAAARDRRGTRRRRHRHLLQRHAQRRRPGHAAARHGARRLHASGDQVRHRPVRDRHGSRTAHGATRHRRHPRHGRRPRSHPTPRWLPRRMGRARGRLPPAGLGARATRTRTSPTSPSSPPRTGPERRRRPRSTSPPAQSATEARPRRGLARGDPLRGGASTGL